jgi:hypothetical protein
LQLTAEYPLVYTRKTGTVEPSTSTEAADIEAMTQRQLIHLSTSEALTTDANETTSSDRYNTNETCNLHNLHSDKKEL